jgi:hypothetical protein
MESVGKESRKEDLSLLTEIGRFGFTSIVPQSEGGNSGMRYIIQ